MWRMGYDLRAVVAQRDAAGHFAKAVAGDVVDLNQGFALVPITDEVFDGLGGGEERRYSEAFGYLSQAIVDSAAAASRYSPLAYVEVDLFGGSGIQAAVVWRGGQAAVSPLVTQLPSPPHTRGNWAVNVALREIGVQAANAIDEFEAVGLDGGPRHIEDWGTS